MATTRILVTGAAGYIGSVLCRQLLAAGYQVRAVDNLLFGGESLLELLSHKKFEFIKADIRDREAMATALKSVKAVVHLAALVGDKACQMQPFAATSIMDVGSKALYRQAKTARVKHFIFASTCSNYGIMKGSKETLLNEDSPLQPQSHYARLKVDFEKHLLEEAKPPRTILRFATVYGVSPRMRFDLSVNHFTKEMALDRYLDIFGAKSWRPYCHVQDLARSVLMVIEAGPEAMDGMVFNVGDSKENYTKKALIEAMSEQIPDAYVNFRKGNRDDPRDYRVDFSRIKKVLKYKITQKIPDGIAEVKALIQSGLITDPDDEKYINA